MRLRQLEAKSERQRPQGSKDIRKCLSKVLARWDQPALKEGRRGRLGTTGRQQSAPRSLEGHLAPAALARELGMKAGVMPHPDEVLHLLRSPYHSPTIRQLRILSVQCHSSQALCVLTLLSALQAPRIPRRVL